MIAIILLGPPGSGKGTQGNLIVKNYNLKYYIISDLIRKEIKENREIEDTIKKGELIDDEKVINIFKKHFEENKNCLIDGAPRTLNQAKLFIKFLNEKKYKTIILNIEVSEEKLLKRIENRYFCPKCKRVYNLLYNPPKKDMICDYDEEKLIKRDDDKPEVFKKRMKIFNENNKKIIEFFKKERIEIYNIDGNKELKDVYNEIKNKIDNII